MNQTLLNAALLQGALLCMGLSYFFEVQAYEAITPGMAFLGIPLPIAMAFTFNYCKFGLIWVIARSRLRGSLISRAVKYLAILLSLIATLIVASQAAHEPNLDQELKARRHQTETEYRQWSQELQARATTEEAASRQRHAQLRAEAQTRHQQAVLDYEAKRNQEMDIKDRQGNFIGNRYKEYARLLDEARAGHQRELDRLREEERREQQVIQERLTAARQSLDGQRATDLARLTLENLHGTEAVQNPKLLPVLHLINAVAGVKLTPIHLALAVGLLITFIVEFAPIGLVTYVARQEDAPRFVGEALPNPVVEGRGGRKQARGQDTPPAPGALRAVRATGPFLYRIGVDGPHPRGEFP